MGNDLTKPILMGRSLLSWANLEFSILDMIIVLTSTHMLVKVLAAWLAGATFTLWLLDKSFQDIHFLIDKTIKGWSSANEVVERYEKLLTVEIDKEQKRLAGEGKNAKHK